MTQDAIDALEAEVLARRRALSASNERKGAELLGRLYADVERGLCEGKYASPAQFLADAAHVRACAGEQMGRVALAEGMERRVGEGVTALVAAQQAAMGEGARAVAASDKARARAESAAAAAAAAEAARAEEVRVLEARCVEMEAGHRQLAQQAEGALALERQVHHA